MANRGSGITALQSALEQRKRPGMDRGPQHSKQYVYHHKAANDTEQTCLAAHPVFAEVSLASLDFSQNGFYIMSCDWKGTGDTQQ